ncbi:MAG: pyruvate ferredoxin oxidoreductase subunit gamma [Candidatus Bathyarchaeota archaeon]
MLVEARWHGRGGQGAVTAAEIVAHAVIDEGRYAQAFPSFGPERRGAPVVAFNRFDDKPIHIRSDVYEPDVVVVLDPTLIRAVNVVEGLKPNGVVVINTKISSEELLKAYGFSSCKVAVVDATRIALDVIGVPVVNTPMVGAFVKVTGLVKLESILKSVSERFKGSIGEKNIEAVIKAYNTVSVWG